MEVGKRGKVHVEDIVFLIRKDPKKYARVKVRKETNTETFYSLEIYIIFPGAVGWALCGHTTTVDSR